MLIIGISGGTGSGKTTIVNEITKHLPLNEISIISQDSYYKETTKLSNEERIKINFDHPNAIDFDLMSKHLQELKSGKTIAQPIYSFVTHNRTTKSLKTQPTQIVLVEGILIFNNETLRNLFDIKIFIEADTDKRLIRRIKRDLAERGRDLNEVLNRYQQTLKPMHEKFIAPTKNFADIIIPNNEYNNTAINIIKTVIEKYLENNA